MEGFIKFGLCLYGCVLLVILMSYISIFVCVIMGGDEFFYYFRIGDLWFTRIYFVGLNEVRGIWFYWKFNLIKGWKSLDFSSILWWKSLYKLKIYWIRFGKQVNQVGFGLILFVFGVTSILYCSRISLFLLCLIQV